MRPVIKFTELTQLSSSQVNLSSVIPIVQDNINYTISLSAIPLLRDTYTTVQSNSAAWDAHTDPYDDSLLQSTSATWNSTYSTVSANSAAWDAHTDPYDDSLLQSTSGNWNSTYSTVSANSAAWDAHTDPYDDSLLQSTSGNWNSTYSTVSANSAAWDNTQQTIITSNSALDLDVSLGESAVTTLTSHVTSFTISNTVSGDSGMIVVSSDGGGWTFPADVYPSLVMAGDLADIATLTNSISSRITIGWYYDGQFNYLYISNAIA